MGSGMDLLRRCSYIHARERAVIAALSCDEQQKPDPASCTVSARAPSCDVRHAKRYRKDSPFVNILMNLVGFLTSCFCECLSKTLLGNVTPWLHLSAVTKR